MVFGGCAETVAPIGDRGDAEVLASDVGEDVTLDATTVASDAGGDVFDGATGADADSVDIGEVGGSIDAGDAAVDAEVALDGGDGSQDAMRDVVDADSLDPRVCERAPTIGAGTIHGFFAGATEPVATCYGGASLPMVGLFGRVEVPPRHLLRATAPFAVSLFEGCDTARCVTAQYSATSAVFIHEGEAPRALTLAVAAPFSSAPFSSTLRVEMVPLRPEDICAAAPVVSSDVTARVDPGPAIESRPRCDGSTAAAPASFVRVRVAPGFRVAASTTDGLVRFFGDCGATTCLASPQSGWTAWTNDGAAERLITLAVSSTGPRDVSIAFGPVPPESRCSTAPALPMGLSTRSHTAAGALDPSCGSRALAQWFRATVPPGARLNVVVGASPHAPVIRIVDACDSARCLDCVDAWNGFGAGNAIWDNTTQEAREVRVAITSAATPFTLRGLVAPIPDALRCDDAPILSPGPALRHVSLQNRGEPIAVCGSTARGRVYRVRVPGLHRLAATLAATRDDVRASLASACRSGVCLAQASTTFGPSRLGWINAGPAERELVLLLAQEGTSAIEAFADVDLAHEPPLDHARCSGARLVRAGDVITDARETDVREPASLCDGTSATASALYYAIDVPAGRRLVVTGQLGTVVQGRMALFDACAGVCLAGNASTNGTLMWRNDGAARRATVAFFGTTFAVLTRPYALTFAVE